VREVIVMSKPTVTKKVRGKGQPRAFETEQEFTDKFNKYLKHCETKELFANIAGFCVFTDITRETYYKQKEYYSDTFKKIENALENSTLQDKNTTRSIFYLKNKFGYADKQEINSVNYNMNKEMTEEEADEILKKAGVKVDS